MEKRFVPPAGSTDIWNGYTRHLFTVDGCQAWIVEPKQALPGNPWTWCLEFPDAFTPNTGVLQLLAKGFFHVHIVVGNTFGCPAAIKHFEAFYPVLQQSGLAVKGALVALSRGGLYAYNWTSRHPDTVACIYADNPVGDFKSWPGGKGKGPGSANDWKKLLDDYEFKSESEAMAWPHNPIDSLAPIAKAGIPLLHVVGDIDEVVPLAENSAIVEKRYRALGGSIEMIHKPECLHHPHGLEEPTPIVEFILRHAATAAARA